MTSPLPPRRRDTTSRDHLLRQDRQNLRQLAPGMVSGRFPPAKPQRAPGEGDIDEDDDELELIQFANTDQAVCSGPSVAIPIKLTHPPEDGSEQVFYNGTPLKRGDWTRTDSILTIPGEPWFRAGKTAWVDYAYYDTEPDTEPAAFVAVTMIYGDHSTIDLPAVAPGTSGAGDMLVLAMRARDAATCSDARMASKIATGGSGIFVGTDDGSGAPLSINLSAASVGGGDAAGALMRISGAPLLPATSEATSSGSGSPFSPTIPATGSLGVMAICSGVGLVASAVTDDQLSHWTTRARVQGSGSGFASVYIGTAVGLPTGQWANPGGSPSYMAWAGGIQ